MEGTHFLYSFQIPEAGSCLNNVEIMENIKKLAGDRCGIVAYF